MFDNVCRYLSERFSADIAAWLLGEPITLTRLSPTELSLQPLRADALILLEKALIRQVLRTEIMRESVIYQDIFEQGEARGKAEGKAEGKMEVARNLLKLGMAIAQIAEVTGLTVEQVSQLQSE